MELEKPEERTLTTQLASMKDFQDSVQQLWDQHVRADLIYGKKLRFCKTCVSFYYQGEAGSEHPPEDTETVQRLFTETGINTAARLAAFLWSSYSKLAIFAPNSGNFLATKHQPKPLPSSPGVGTAQLAGLQAKAQTLQHHVAEMSKRLEEMEQEKAVLQRENEEIMGELLRTRTAGEMNLARIQRLTCQISSLCHPTGCCCGEETKDSGN
jgi:hypothetical protein